MGRALQITLGETPPDPEGGMEVSGEGKKRRVALPTWP